MYRPEFSQLVNEYHLAVYDCAWNYAKRLMLQIEINYPSVKYQDGLFFSSINLSNSLGET